MIYKYRELGGILFKKQFIEMPRKKVDLTKLPSWQQYLIATIVVGLVVGLVYVLKGKQPIPPWIQTYLTEKADVTAVVLVALFIFVWLVRRLTR